MSDPLRDVPTHRMTADEFITWAMGRDARCELEDGHVVAMAPERVAHARVKARVLRALEDAIAHAGLSCEALPDGVAVVVDDGVVYEPDALVRCGAPLPDEATQLSDPVVVVEVWSPSTGSRDEDIRFVDYVRLPSVRHYLRVFPARRIVVHHARREGAAEIATRILGEGALRLDPPGLDLDVAAFFPAR